MIVPYQALTGAELSYESILPIHVSGDTMTVNRLTINGPTDLPPVNYSNRRVEFENGGRRWRREWQNYRAADLYVMHQPINGTGRWHLVNRFRSGEVRFTERVHNLGSSVFSAIGPDGERHRYISAFDTQESTPMYFLAQLPDQGECANYGDAINLLAPPIVHQARKEGKRVYRQGDIFAIETNLTVADLREQKAEILQRSLVLE